MVVVRLQSRVGSSAKCTLALVVVATALLGCVADEFDALVAKLDADAIELAHVVEDLYQTRCNANVLATCAHGNYQECISQFPSQYCYQGPDLALEACGDGNQCSALWDYTTSAVRLPEGTYDPATFYPHSTSIVESMCMTQSLDNWFVSKRDSDAGYWKRIGVRSPQMYVGMNNGFFRIYPGRQSEKCGAYDPRKRPWYIAGSSGPKNVVLVLDTSGSMKGAVIDLLKEAAKQVIESLTVSDRVAIVTFASESTVYADRELYLYEASAENKEILTNAIDGLAPFGGTNAYLAFQVAFAILDESITQELHVGCNTALLFLTDGEMTEPAGVNETEVIDYVGSSIQRIEGMAKWPIYLFTYSVSRLENVHEFPKQLACMATPHGVWNKIDDSRNIYEALTSYYLLFALGLGTDANSDFTSWVEPYHFATGNILGTTVSAPVYDRSVDPPVFLGVAALDIPLASVDQALGVGPGSPESLDRIVRLSTAVCPTIELSACELEAYRLLGFGGEEATCTDLSNCTSSQLEMAPQGCASDIELPQELYADTSYFGLSYEMRACCAVFSSEPTDQCPADSGKWSKGMIAGVSVGAAAGLTLLVFATWWCCFRYGPEDGDHAEQPRKATAPVQEGYERPPPIAPHMAHLSSSAAPTNVSTVTPISAELLSAPVYITQSP